jgi:hypothetical protein
MNNFNIRTLNVTVSIDYSHIDIDQVIKDEVEMHIGEPDTPELRATIAKNISEMIKPVITLGENNLQTGAHSR